MNTIKAANPQEPVAEQGREYPAIAVRILIAEDAMTASLFPARNRWATRFLSRLLGNCIERAGIALRSADYAFAFNRSFYLFTLYVRPAGPALKAVFEELGVNGVAEFSQIAWRDYDELVWRLYRPTSGAFTAPSKDDFVGDAAAIEKERRALRNWLSSHGYAGE
jgi:hypothetical protein